MSAAAPAERGRVPLYLTVTGTMLAGAILLARVAADRGAPMLWLLVAGLGAAGLLELAVARLGGPAPVTRGVLAYSAGSGLLMAVPIAIAYLAVPHVGAGYVAFVHAPPILLTWVLARLLGLEGRSVRRLLAVLLGLAGAGLLAAAKLAGAPPGVGGWTLAASAIPAMLALGNIYRSRFWPKGAGPVLLAALMLLGAALAILPVALAVEGPRAATGLLAPRVAPILAALIAAYAVQYITYFRLQQAGGPVMLSLIGPFAGIAGPLGAVLLLGEALPAVFPLAAALTFAGVALMLSARR